MAFLTSLKYISFLWYNQVVQKSHTWTATWTSVPGQTTAMLDDDDATSVCKATSVLTDPILEVTFGSAQSCDAFGICNHNLYSAGVREIYLEYHNGSTFVAIDSNPIPLASDRDIAVVFNAQTRTRFRFKCLDVGGGSVTPTAFYIGYVYWGIHWQFSRNPTEFLQTRRPAIRYIQSAGGMTHAVKGMAYRPGTLEMNFFRAKVADVMQMNRLELSQYIMAVIPPEAVTDPTLAPRGNDIFYGRIEEISVDPQTPSNIALGSEVYNMSVLMRGAV